MKGDYKMEITKKVTVDMLTSESVSILTQQFVEIDGVLTQVGKNHRKAYVNTESGRKAIELEQDDSTVQAVFAIWGDTPIVVEESETNQPESE